MNGAISDYGIQLIPSEFLVSNKYFMVSEVDKQVAIRPMSAAFGLDW
jgi:hypothetical protein